MEYVYICDKEYERRMINSMRHEINNNGIVKEGENGLDIFIKSLNFSN